MNDIHLYFDPIQFFKNGSQALRLTTRRFNRVVFTKGYSNAVDNDKPAIKLFTDYLKRVVQGKEEGQPFMYLITPEEYNRAKRHQDAVEPVENKNSLDKLHQLRRDNYKKHLDHLKKLDYSEWVEL